MIVDVAEEDSTNLSDYARIPIAFEVREVVDVIESAHRSRRFELTSRSIQSPYVKDYDVSLISAGSWK